MRIVFEQGIFMDIAASSLAGTLAFAGCGAQELPKFQGRLASVVVGNPSAIGYDSVTNTYSNNEYYLTLQQCGREDSDADSAGCVIATIAVLRTTYCAFSVGDSIQFNHVKSSTTTNTNGRQVQNPCG